MSGNFERSPLEHDRPGPSLEVEPAEACFAALGAEQCVVIPEGYAGSYQDIIAFAQQAGVAIPSADSRVAQFVARRVDGTQELMGADSFYSALQAMGAKMDRPADDGSLSAGDAISQFRHHGGVDRNAVGKPAAGKSRRRPVGKRSSSEFPSARF